MRLSTRLAEIALEAVPPAGGAPAAGEPAPLAESEPERIRLGALWRDRPVVLVFIRHFG